MPTNTDERPRVYLNKVRLKGYKSIEDVTIDFQKGLNILIGKNGAGKSNFLEFLNSSIRYMRFGKNDFRFAKLEFISENGHSIDFEIEEKKQTRDYLDDDIFHFEGGVLEKIIIDGDRIFDSSKDRLTRNGIRVGNSRVSYTGISRFINRIGYQTESPLFIKFSFPDGLGLIDQAGELSVETDDSDEFWNHPKTLNFLRLLFLDLFDENIWKDKSLTQLKASDILKYLKIPDVIIDNLKLFTPLEDVRFNSNLNLYFEGTKIIVDNVKLEFKVNGSWLPWTHLSDGTRRLFYIVSEITNASGLVLLEEPELGVHPHQFHLLMNFLKEQSAHKQIIISTHAPKALDHLKFDELNNILIVNYDQKHGTQLRHLTDKEQTQAIEYAKEIGYISDYWMYSDLEE